MLREERVTKLVDWFVKAAIAHAEAIEAMHEHNASVQTATLTRLYAAIKRENGVEQFLFLLSHPNPDISGMAAVFAMRDAPELCCAHLAKLAQMPGLLGLRAAAALERWESGDWSL